MSRPYAILDVFTETPLAGNGLAVVLDAERARRQADAGDRPRVQPVGDGLRAAGGEAGAQRPAAHLHAGERGALCRPSHRRHGGAAGHAQGGRGQRAGQGDDAAPGGDRRAGPLPASSSRARRPGTRSSTFRRCRRRCRPSSTAMRWRRRSACCRRRSASKTTSRAPGRRACLSSSCRSAAWRRSAMPRSNVPAWSGAFGSPMASVWLYCRETESQRQRFPCPHVRAGLRHRRGSGDRQCRVGLCRRRAPLRRAAVGQLSLRDRAGLRDGPAEPDHDGDGRRRRRGQRRCASAAMRWWWPRARSPSEPRPRAAGDSCYTAFERARGVRGD